MAGRLLKRWQAHRIGHVTAMCTTPWGELWTGSSRGIIRVWLGANKPGEFVISVCIWPGLGRLSVAGEHTAVYIHFGLLALEGSACG